jgi:hypothetical protein
MVVSGQEYMDTRFTFDNGETSSHSMEVLYLIRRSHKIMSDLLPVFPVNDGCFEQALFGGTCNGRLLIGHEQGVYEYRKLENRWSSVHHQCFNNNDVEGAEFTKFCVTQERVVICGGHIENNNRRNKQVQLLKFQRESDQYLTNIKCPTLLPISLDRSHVLTSIGKNQIVLLGGNYPTGYDHPLARCVFQGSLSCTNDDIIWKRMEPLKLPRISPLVFKMNDMIYVAGGVNQQGSLIRSCERYDMSTRTWEVCKHSLPFNADVKRASVVVSSDELLAIIIGCKDIPNPPGESSSREKHIPRSNGLTGHELIVFCETKGFSMIDKNEFSTKIRFCSKRHISIIDQT